MDDDFNDGITLQGTIPLEEATTIDWDAVLRDLVWAHDLYEQEHAHDLDWPEDSAAYLHLTTNTL